MRFDHPVHVLVQHGDLALGDARLARAEPFSPKDRKRIAKYLYGERSWTMARIGAALNVEPGDNYERPTGFGNRYQTSAPQGGAAEVPVETRTAAPYREWWPGSCARPASRGDVTTALRRNLAVESRSAPASALCSIWIVL